MGIFNNPWVIGIGTSIISGLVVFLITRKFLSTKENKEYNQRVKTANNEILYAFRPLIVQKNIPDQMIIDSIFISISKKYNVYKKDIYDTISLADDLINEIMSNAFLASDQKLEFCQLISKIKQNEKISKEEKPSIIQIEKKSDTTSYFSYIIATMTAAMAGIISILTYFSKEKDLLKNSEFFEPITTILIAIAIPTFILLSATLVKIIRDKWSEDDKRSEDNKALQKEKLDSNKNGISKNGV